MSICSGDVRAARAARTRAAIIRAAVELVWTAQSIDAVSIEEIAEAAGVSRRTVFNHVPGKMTALLMPLFEVRSQYVRAAIEAPGDLDPWRTLELAVHAALAAVEDLPTAARSEAILSTLVHASTSGEMPSRDADEAHSRALADSLRDRLGRDDHVAVSLLMNIGDHVLRLALREALTGGDADATVTHSFTVLRTLIQEQS